MFGHHLLIIDVVVLQLKSSLSSSISFEEFGIARIFDVDLTHHLANDHFNVLIIDPHTLQTINFLDLIHHIFLYGKWSFDRKDIRRRCLAITQWRTRFHEVTILHQDLAGQWHKVFSDHAIFCFHDDLPVTTFDRTEGYNTIDFANNSRVAWVTRFKKFRYPWQTSCDIPQLA